MVYLAMSWNPLCTGPHDFVCVLFIPHGSHCQHENPWKVLYVPPMAPRSKGHQFANLNRLDKCSPFWLIKIEFTWIIILKGFLHPSQIEYQIPKYPTPNKPIMWHPVRA